MHWRRRLVAAFMVVGAVAGCTTANEPQSTEPPTRRPTPAGRAERAASPEPAPVEPRWTPVELPREAQLSEARVSFDGGVLAGTERLPHMVAGVAAQPGTPDQVRLWLSDDTDDWEAVDVALRSGADAAVAASVTDGAMTALVGSTWSADAGLRPFVLRSDDRRAWEEVALPGPAVERAVAPQAVAVVADGALLVVGVDRDERPVAVVAGEDGRVVDLPAVPGTLEQRGFGGIAADGDLVVALAHVGEPGEGGHPITYRSADAGATWRLEDGPTTETAQVSGIVHTVDGFLATGWASETRFTKPAAWSSADGRRWKQEDVPRTGGSDGPLSAPAARGNQVVAAYSEERSLRAVVVRRDASGQWSIRGTSDRWIAPYGSAAVAPLADGSVLVARWIRNSGIIGVMADFEWTTVRDTIGPDGDGLTWTQLMLAGEVPTLTGSTTTVELYEPLGWRRQGRPRRFTFTDGGTIVAARWEPPASERLVNTLAASDDAGATVVLGTRRRKGGGQQVRVDETDVVGWFRAAPDAPWTRAEGLAGPRTESVNGVFWLGDQWIAVGEDHERGHVNVHRRAAVWTSADGVRWRRREGPFDLGEDHYSWASGACRLPGGRGALVVGAAQSERGTLTPEIWRGTGERWIRVERAAIGGGEGSLRSCAVRHDVTVVQGHYRNRATLWRTTEGDAFEGGALGGRGELFGTVRPLASGFAAAGSRIVAGHPAAVVWLSHDGTDWRAVPVPSDRRHVGADILDWDGRLVVATTSASGPQVWILENPDEVLSTAIAGS